MEQAVQESLVRIFGEEDVSFDRVERKLYSHDVGSVPRLINPSCRGASRAQLFGLAVRDHSWNCSVSPDPTDWKWCRGARPHLATAAPSRARTRSSST